LDVDRYIPSSTNASVASSQTSSPGFGNGSLGVGSSVTSSPAQSPIASSPTFPSDCRSPTLSPSPSPSPRGPQLLSPCFSPISRSPRHSTHIPYLNDLYNNKLYNSKRASLASPILGALGSPHNPPLDPRFSTTTFSPTPHFIPPSLSRHKVAQTPHTTTNNHLQTAAPKIVSSTADRSSLQSPMPDLGSSSTVSSPADTSFSDYNYGVANRSMPIDECDSSDCSMSADYNLEPLNRTWSSETSQAQGRPKVDKSSPNKYISKHREGDLNEYLIQ
jgi:hypothetical protein